MAAPCRYCGGEAVKDVRSSGNAGGLAMALLVLCLGVLVFVLVPVVGWVAGPVICLLALFMGGKREKVWRCRSCRAYWPRW